MSADLLREAAKALRERAEKSSPAPWSYNGYSNVLSNPKLRADEDFWTDERLNDDHTYEHKVGATCPACGERPAIQEDGKRFGTYWDCARWTEAYDIDATVANVPAHHGDTAIHQHAADADYIATMHPGVGLALADWLDAVAARAAELTETLPPGSSQLLPVLVRNISGYVPMVAVARLILGRAS